MHDAFIVARNPEADSVLPYLVFLPIDDGTWLKARETWPRSSRVYCHPAGALDTVALEVLERIGIVSCQRRGPVVDLVLDRGTNRRAIRLHERPRPADDLLADGQSRGERPARLTSPAVTGARARPNRDRYA